MRVHPVDRTLWIEPAIEQVEESQELDCWALEERVRRDMVRDLDLPVVTHRGVAVRAGRHLAWPEDLADLPGDLFGR